MLSYANKVEKRITIIGKANGWEEAPMEGETWGVGDLVTRRPVKLAFEMHNIDAILANELVNYPMEKTIEKVNELGIPIITREKHRLLPTAIPFPLDKMPVKYFTSSVTYMIAYAIYKRSTAIDIYGVECRSKEEYRNQRPCTEFWIGSAMALGIDVTVHGRGFLLSPYPHEGLYGYDSWKKIP